MDESLRALERRAALGDPGARERLERARARAAESTSLVLSELDELEAALEATTDAFVTAGVEDFDRYVAALFEREPDLQVVRLRGFTPGFCDGDRCEHEQSVALDPGGDDAHASGGQVPPERGREYARAFEAFAPLLHLRHGTDWQLLLRRGPGPGAPVQRELGAWSCGY